MNPDISIVFPFSVSATSLPLRMRAPHEQYAGASFFLTPGVLRTGAAIGFPNLSQLQF